MKKIIKIMLYTFIAIGLLGILDTIFVLIISAGFSLGSFLPGIAGIIFILFSIINLIKKKPIFTSIKLRRAIIIIICFCIMFFIVIEAFIISGADTKKAENTEVNFVIVLGCGVFPDGTLTLTLKNRLDAAIGYLEKYPDSLCIVSGGQGPTELYSEAYSMNKYLLSQGIDKKRIMLEEKATSSSENLLYSSDIMSEKFPMKQQSAALVSSEFHIYRVMFLAERYGMSAIGIPCETPWYIRGNCYMREFFAVIKSFLFDVR